MGDIAAFPLHWPAGQKRRSYPKRAGFGERSFASARDALMRELRLLGAKRLILSTNIPLKRDGMPGAISAQPADRGVAVYFTFKERPMVFACDEWDKIEHNLWAIAKTIEALRGIERWGSGEMLERSFAGFQALPPASKQRDWREVLSFPPNAQVGLEMVRSRYRQLASANHPDKGGNASTMAEINRGYELALKELGG